MVSGSTRTAESSWFTVSHGTTAIPWLNPTKRAADFQAADKILASAVPQFPLYQRPLPLIYKNGILGMKNNPAIAGPFWNIEDWHWKA